MATAQSVNASELYHEIETPPEECLPARLEIVRGFRHGMKEALSGNTMPVAELWKGIDAP